MAKCSFPFEKTARLVVFSITIFLCLITIASGQNNVCSLSRITPLGRLAFSADVMISNSIAIAGFQIPFNYGYANIGIRCDSINFRNSDCANFGFQDIKINNTDHIAYFSAIADVYPDTGIAPLAPGNHKIATIYFSIDRLDRNASISFSKSKMPDEQRDYSWLFWTPDAQEVAFTFGLNQITLR